MESQILSISQASKIAGVSRQGVYVAIKANHLKAFKSGVGPQKFHWKIKMEDLLEYINNKYSRLKSVDEKGEKLFHPDRGVLSPEMLAQKKMVPRQRIYYLIRSGQIPHQRFGAAYIIKEEDIPEFLFPKPHLKNQTCQKKTRKGKIKIQVSEVS